MKGKVQCLICKKWFKQLSSHLKNKHNMTGNEYKKLFPDALLASKTLVYNKKTKMITEWVNKNQNKHLCNCGCGNYIKMERRYYHTGIPKIISGHQPGVEKDPIITEWVIENQGKHFCHCGCGEEIIIERRYYSIGIPKYIYNHHTTKGIKLSEKAKKSISEKNSGINSYMYGKKSHNHDYEIDQWIKENQGKYFCYCGCGKEIIILRDHYWTGIPKYLNHHYGDSDEGKIELSLITKKYMENIDNRIQISCTLRDIPVSEFDGFTTSERVNFYSSHEYKRWRKFVIKRDNNTCQECNTKIGVKHIHHILPWRDYPESEYSLNIDNGITLCIECHKKTYGKEYNFVIKYISKIFDNKGIKIFGDI